MAALLLWLFHVRARFGLAPLFVAIGTFQYLQVVLARSIYIEVWPGVLISPGSAILFTSTLFAVLLVYIREDAAKTRELIVGLVAANITLALLSLLLGWQLDVPGTHNLLDLPRALFVDDARMLFVGTASLVVDVFLVIVLYEVVSRVLPRVLFLRIFTAMAIVLTWDSLLFAAGAFWGEPDFWRLVGAGILGKVGGAFFFSAVMSTYLRIARRQEVVGELAAAEVRDVFEILSFRQRYERMRERVERDPMTGLFNRGFFDEVLPLELARSTRSKVPTSLLLADLDQFKVVNDRFGHQEGDRILKEFAAALADAVRSEDVACRIGGEEFAVILPHAPAKVTRQLAERIRRRFAERLASAEPALRCGPVTVTIGLATYPIEAEDGLGLFRLADERLYQGKRQGRDRVVGATETTDDPGNGDRSRGALRR